MMDSKAYLKTQEGQVASIIQQLNAMPLSGGQKDIDIRGRRLAKTVLRYVNDCCETKGLKYRARLIVPPKGSVVLRLEQVLI